MQILKTKNFVLWKRNNMKAIKIIDLLGKMEKDIGIPKKIIYNFYTYEYHKEQNDYFNKNVGYLFDKYNVVGILNDTVAIIEDTPKEDKKIEYIETNYDFVFDEQVQQDSLRVITSKINEIIDKVNGE